MRSLYGRLRLSWRSLHTLNRRCGARPQRSSRQARAFQMASRGGRFGRDRRPRNPLASPGPTRLKARRFSQCIDRGKNLDSLAAPLDATSSRLSSLLFSSLSHAHAARSTSEAIDALKATHISIVAHTKPSSISKHTRKHAATSLALSSSHGLGRSIAAAAAAAASG